MLSVDHRNAAWTCGHFERERVQQSRVQESRRYAEPHHLASVRNAIWPIVHRLPAATRVGQQGPRHPRNSQHSSLQLSITGCDYTPLPHTPACVASLKGHVPRTTHSCGWLVVIMLQEHADRLTFGLCV